MLTVQKKSCIVPYLVWGGGTDFQKLKLLGLISTKTDVKLQQVADANSNGSWFALSYTSNRLFFDFFQNQINFSSAF